jgi:hypothetical protein
MRVLNMERQGMKVHVQLVSLCRYIDFLGEPSAKGSFTTETIALV